MGMREAGNSCDPSENRPNIIRLPKRGHNFGLFVSLTDIYSERCGDDSIKLLRDDAKARGIPVSCHDDPE